MKKIFKGTRKKEIAFTLAETLITLGIIGVVAAMTIPNLINNYKAQKLRTQFLKTYSTIQQVFKQMEDDGVSDDNSYYHEGHSYHKIFAKYLKGATICSGNNSLCYLDISSNKVVYKGISKFHLDDGQVLLPDGTLLMFENMYNSEYIMVTADINGLKNPPNIEGYDTFSFQLIDGELHTMGDKGTWFVGNRYCDIGAIFDQMKEGTISAFLQSGMSCAQKAKTDTDYFKKLVKKYK